MYLTFDSKQSPSAVSPTSTPTEYFIHGDRPCPDEFLDHCQNEGICFFKLELEKWKGPVCRCTEMFYGLRCELFRPPGSFLSGMLTEKQTFLLAGGIFIGLVLITLIICIVVGVRWYRHKLAESQDNNVEQPLMNGAANGADSISNNNNNDDVSMPMKVHVQTVIPAAKDSPVNKV